MGLDCAGGLVEAIGVEGVDGCEEGTGLEAIVVRILGKRVDIGEFVLLGADLVDICDFLEGGVRGACVDFARSLPHSVILIIK